VTKAFTVTVPGSAPTARRAAVAPADVSADVSADVRAAVLVCHGMGQQVRFATLDDIARAVATEASRVEGHPIPVSSDLVVDADGELLARTTLTLTVPAVGDRPERPLRVDFFEAYWAPLTEGKVTLWDSLRLFLNAGRRGVVFAFRDGAFDRWMFGARQEFQIPPRAIIQLGLAAAVLVSVSLSFPAYLMLAATGVLKALGSAWPSRAATARLAAGAVALLAFALLTAVVGGVGAGLSERWRRRRREPHQRTERGGAHPVASSVPARIVAGLGCALVLCLCCWLGLHWTYRWLVGALADNTGMPGLHSPGAAIAVGLLVIGGVVLLFLRYFLIEYAGDVAAYVSPYEVSKFQELRDAVQSVGRRVARYVYGSTEGGRPVYDSVYVVGHSLGSVVAYDTLDDAINREIRAGAWPAPDQPWNVVGRTRLLLTFGSPLDKTAFIFRTQQLRQENDIRESLAANMQPMILSYAYRPRRWINLWSPFDWISGVIDYYDQPDPPRDQCVRNVPHRGSKFPPCAHVDYWKRPLLRGLLYAAITGICPESDPEVRRVLDQLVRDGAPLHAGAAAPAPRLG
jgi:hypothetical protein